MSCQIILNSSHWDSGTNKFRYTFPNAQNFNGKEVALTTCNINNQFFNVRSALGNNKINVIWPMSNSGNTGKLFQMILQDGYYSISDINANLQQMMFNNYLYTKDDAGNVNYYIDIEANSTYYTCDITCTKIPFTNASALGQHFPASAPFSTGTQNLAPYLLFNKPLGELLGFTTDKYKNDATVSGIDQCTITNGDAPSWNIQVPVGDSGAKGFKTSTSYSSSDFSPEINIVSSLIITCSLVNNVGISNPTNIINAMPVSNVAIGNQITLPNSYPIYQPVAANQYREVVISFLDQLAVPVYIMDPDVLIILSIRDGKEKKRQ